MPLEFTSHTFLTPFRVARPFILVRAKPQIILPFKWNNTAGDSTSHSHGRDNMVKTGIPYMLYDRTGSLLGCDFVDLYDRMSLRVSCRRRNPDGAAMYEVYNMLSRYDGIPVAVFEYGSAGALGNISLIGPGGSLQRHAMATFLVEAGGYANSINPFLVFLLRSFCIQTFIPYFCKA